MPPNARICGIPAITPHLPTVPSFTPEDVIAHCATQGFMMGKIRKGHPPTITAISFSNLATMQRQLGIKGYPTADPDLLFCCVQVAGEFVVYNPDGGALTYAQGYMFFDAETGNRIGTGTLGIGRG